MALSSMVRLSSHSWTSQRLPISPQSSSSSSKLSCISCSASPFHSKVAVPKALHVGDDRTHGRGRVHWGICRGCPAHRPNPRLCCRLPHFPSKSMLYWPMSNTLYVEGYALDKFAEGSWALQPVHQNKVGLVLDAGIEEELRIRHLQVADATRASLGLPVIEYIVTDSPLKVEMWIDPTCGKSTGRIKNPDSLLRAVHNLVSRTSVNAVAVVGRFPDDTEELDDYRQGKGVDLLAGVEAIISHLLVKEFLIPCAHAPALSPLPISTSLCPRSAAEEIGYTFLPCVLAGLSNAPQYVVLTKSGSLCDGCVTAGDVDSIVLPIDACGGNGALAFSRKSKTKTLIIAVEENETVLDDTPDKLGIEAIKVSNYWEAIGVIAAHKAGVDPRSLRRNRIKNIKCTSTRPSIDHKSYYSLPAYDRVGSF